MGGEADIRVAHYTLPAPPAPLPPPPNLAVHEYEALRLGAPRQLADELGEVRAEHLRMGGGGEGEMGTTAASAVHCSARTCHDVTPPLPTSALRGACARRAYMATGCSPPPRAPCQWGGRGGEAADAA